MRRTRCFLAVLTASLFTSLFSLPLFSQTFSQKTYAPYQDSYQLAVGDFNHDGAADLIGVSPYVNGSQSQVYLYLNNGSGGFGAPTIINGTGEVGAETLAVGDFNGDGNLDFAFITSNQVGVVLGDGKGGFGSPAFYSVNGAADAIAVGDYNGDGKPDIATLSDTTKTVTILTNTGTSFTSYNFTVPLYFSSNNSGYPPDNIADLVAGDFDGTHRIDLAYLDECADSNCGPGLARVYTLTNNGNNTFTPALLSDQFSESDALYAADMDLDGKVDLIVTEENSASGVNTIAVEYSNGNSSFTQVDANTLLGAGFPMTLQFGDFNNDGILDIAALTDLASGTLDPDYGFDIYSGLGGRSGFNDPQHYADNTTYIIGGFQAAFYDLNGTKDIALDDNSGLSMYSNTTSTAKDPCPYLTGTNLLNVCSPTSAGVGPSPVHVLARYKALVQPAQRIEVWADGKKLFQEYGDLLNTNVTLANGTHSLAVVGVDATGKYITADKTYTVVTACGAPKTAGVKICTPANGSTDASPVTVSAAATSSSGLSITATRLYVDNISIYTSNTASLYDSVVLSKGSHYLVVVGYESNGAALTSSATITVN